jgi:hypothetical protein
MVAPREIVQVADSEPVRQGDILRHYEPGNVSEAYCVVLTADCDISNDKFGDFYSVLPIVSASDYLTKIWIVRRLKANHDRAVEALRKVCTERLSKKMGTAAEIDRLTISPASFRQR